VSTNNAIHPWKRRRGSKGNREPKTEHPEIIYKMLCYWPLNSSGQSFRLRHRPSESNLGFRGNVIPSPILCPIGKNHPKGFFPITSSQFLLLLPAHHKFPSVSILPHSLSHSSLIFLLSNTTPHGVRCLPTSGISSLHLSLPPSSSSPGEHEPVHGHGTISFRIRLSRLEIP